MLRTARRQFFDSQVTCCHCSVSLKRPKKKTLQTAQENDRATLCIKYFDNKTRYGKKQSETDTVVFL